MKTWFMGLLLACCTWLAGCGGGGDWGAPPNAPTPAAARTVSAAPAAAAAAAASFTIPQNGWWWYPPEGGSGYAIEVQGNQIFMASFLYETSGVATWYVSTLTQQADGSYTGAMTRYSGGQSLLGSYKSPTSTQDVATARLSFASATAGTLAITPAGAAAVVRTVPIERFPISTPAFTGSGGSFESGWWWNAAEGGRGYFIEVQGTQAFVGGFMYDTAGQPTWYVSTATLGSGASLSGSLLPYSGGQSLFGGYQTPVAAASVGNLGFSFTGAQTGNMTLPNGASVALTRYVFNPAPSVALFKVASGLYGGPDVPLVLPYAEQSSIDTTLACVGKLCSGQTDLASFRIKTAGQSYTVQNLVAQNLSTGSALVPAFSGLVNGQIIPANQTLTFSAQAGLVRGASGNLNFSFMLKETGQTFSFTANVSVAN